MKFSEIDNLEVLKEQEQKEIPQMSIGQQLEILSKVKEIEYQNSLVMMSLEKYNSKYEQLKKEQTELLEKANQKIETLQKSNEILSQSLKNILESLGKELSKGISSLADSTKKVVEDISKDIDNLLSSKLTDIDIKSKEYIENLEALKAESTKRYQSYFGRKKIIDILTYINLSITPILFFIIVYILIIKN